MDEGDSDEEGVRVLFKEGETVAAVSRGFCVDEGGDGGEGGGGGGEEGVIDVLLLLFEDGGSGVGFIFRGFPELLLTLDGADVGLDVVV